MKNIKDSGKIDNMPNKARMRYHKGLGKYDEEYYNHWGKQRKIIHYLDRFLEKRVGTSYNKAYSDFIEACKNNKDFSVQIGDFNAKDEFNYYFSKQWIPKYIVVNNVIKENPEKRYKKSTPSITISKDVPAYYIWNGKYDEKNPELRACVMSYFGYKIAHHILNERITPAQFAKYVGSDFNWKFSFKGFKDTWNRKLMLKDCFDCYGEGGIVLYKGDEGYDRIKAEDEDTRKKIRRDNKKEKDSKAETLLHDIMEKRKKEELAKDIINRDRHGFDDNSFKGEAYHGQKRKKEKA